MDVIENQCQWTVKPITKEHDEERMKTQDQSNQQEATVVKETNTNKETYMSIESVDFKVNDYVAAVYDREWFPGQITEVDEDDCQLHI
ncbi:hypothetical protein ACJMK2_020192 [Sinanodonta woodiana]|uniref:Tudor domain-containing protein n=1 Tax=Sinanodonta woodiana TaxID=1069815 RepID=A0ABD3U021_SINWO